MHVKRSIRLKMVVLAFLVFSVFAFATTVGRAQTLTLALMSGHWNDNVRSWLETEALPRFYAQNPGVTVEVLYTGGDAKEHLAIWHATGIAPDLFSGTISDDRWATALDRYIMDWEGKSDVIPALMHAGQVDGQQLMMPWSINVRHMYYWRDLVEEAGLSADTPPSTWDQLIESVRRLIRYDGGGGIALHPIVGADQWLYETLYYQAGGTPHAVIPANAQWPEPQPSLDVFEFLQQLYSAAYPLGGPARFGINANNLFTGRGTALFYGPSNLLGVVLEDQEVRGRVDALPPLSRTDSSQPVSVTVNVGLFMSAASEHPKEAWDLMAFLVERENAGVYNVFQGRVPTRGSLLRGEVDLDSPVPGVVGPLLDYAIPSFLTEFSGLAPINNLINQRVAAILSGSQAPASAVEEFAGQIRALQAAAQN